MSVTGILSSARVSAALIALWSCLSLYAQTLRHAVQTATNERGDTELILVNTSEIPITAIHSTYFCTPYPLEVSSDTLVEFALNGSIPPKGTYRYVIPPQATRCPGGIEDIAYADGAHEGSAIGRLRTINRRRAVYDEVSKVRDWVQAVPANEWNSSAFLSFATTRHGQLNKDPAMPKTQAFDEKHARLEAMAAIIRQLKGIGEPQSKVILTQAKALRIMNKWMDVLDNALKLDGVTVASSK
jgi:hypothetical protein